MSALLTALAIFASCSLIALAMAACEAYERGKILGSLVHSHFNGTGDQK